MANLRQIPADEYEAQKKSYGFSDEQMRSIVGVEPLATRWADGYGESRKKEEISAKDKHRQLVEEMLKKEQSMVASQPATEPEPKPEPKPTPQPVFETTPEPAVAPEPAAAPEPEPSPAFEMPSFDAPAFEAPAFEMPTTEETPAKEPEPAPQATPEPAPEPVPTPEESVPTPAPESTQSAEEDAKSDEIPSELKREIDEINAMFEQGRKRLLELIKSDKDSFLSENVRYRGPSRRRRDARCIRGGDRRRRP